MTVAALLALAAGALYPANAPETARKAALAPHFDPRPGTAFALEARDLRDHAKTPVLKMRGYVDVTPPKGVCLTIKLTDDDPDEVVCKPRRLAFTVSQLDRQGRLAWRVAAGDDDFVGTDLTWPSPYRMAIVEPWDKKADDPPTYRFIERCEPSAGEGGRKITLRLLGGESWTIRFPRSDTMLPQPGDQPNLFISVSNEKVSVGQASQHGSGSASGSGSADGHDAPPPPPKPKTEDGSGIPSAPKDPNNSMADRKYWSIPLRGAYEMPASGFQPRGSVAGGMRGRCRYIFDLGEGDPGIGRLECNDVDGFQHVLIPLECLKALGPRK